MDQEIEEILLSIEIDKKAKRIFELRETVLKATTNNAELIVEQMKNLEEGHFVGQNWFENQPYYFLFEAYAHELLQNRTEAIDRANRAIHLLRMRKSHRWKSQWNESRAHWFLGVIYRNNNLMGQAEEELKRAIAILEKLTTLAEQDLNPETLGYCESQIEKIWQVINDLPSQIALPQSSNLLAIPPETFSELILLISIPQRLSYIHELREQIIDIDLSDLSQIESLLTELDDLLEKLQDMPQEYGLILALIAHCYNLSFYLGFDEDKEAERCMIEARNLFQFQHDDYNEALSDWYLALFYNNNSDISKSLSCLGETHYLLEMLLRENHDEAMKQQLRDLKNDVQQWIATCNSQIDLPDNVSLSKSKEIEKPQNNFFDKLKQMVSSSLLAPEKTPYPEEGFDKKTSDTPQVGLRDPKSLKKDLVVSGQRPPMHITIPVDVKALEKTDLASVPLAKELYKQLQRYNEDSVSGETQNSEDFFPEPRDCIVPSFPIFGQVTAGPKGEPYLEEEPIYASAVDESLRINIGQRRYSVCFINNIRVTFVDGKRYGWFRVKGHSMNAARGNPINNNDYLLFCENHEPESCKGNIVVAFLPELDDKRLTVKRLIKLSSGSSFKRNGFGFKIKFMLQSESLLDEDPDTGMSYKKDIEIANDYQLVGNVIAIAKPA